MVFSVTLILDLVIGHSSQLSGGSSSSSSLRSPFKALVVSISQGLGTSPQYFRYSIDGILFVDDSQNCISNICLPFVIHLVFPFPLHSQCLPTPFPDCLQRISNNCYLNTELNLPQSLLLSCFIYVHALPSKQNVKFLKVRKIFTVI